MYLLAYLIDYNSVLKLHRCLIQIFHKRKIIFRGILKYSLGVFGQDTVAH